MKLIYNKDLQHFTATERKYIKIAYGYCKATGETSCSVNTKQFTFDFANNAGTISTRRGTKPFEFIEMGGAAND